MADVKDLSGVQFDEAIASGVTLVDFWAPWCGPCMMQGPIVDQVADQVAGQATVAKLNVDNEPAVAGRFGIRSIPTLIVFKDGEPVQRFTGVQREDALLDAIRENL